MSYDDGAGSRDVGGGADVTLMLSIKSGGGEGVNGVMYCMHTLERI